MTDEPHAASSERPTCPQCSRANPDGYRFCGGCGAAAPAATDTMPLPTPATTAKWSLPEPTEPTPIASVDDGGAITEPVPTVLAPVDPLSRETTIEEAPAAKRGRGALYAVIAGGAVLVAAIVVLFLQVGSVNDDLDATKHTLTSTNGKLAATNSKLAKAQTDRDGLARKLAAREAALATTRAKLADVRQQLVGVKGTLGTQTAELDNYRACVSGLEEVAQLINNGDFAGAQAKEREVAPVCAKIGLF